MSQFKKELRISLAFGILTAIAGAMHFSIPGISGGYSDPREIVALSSIFFLSDWRSALLVGALSALGPPYGSSVFMTFTMHIVAIPIAWKLYQIIKDKFQSLTIKSIFWAAEVVGLYFFVYVPVFILTSYALGTLDLITIPQNYLHMVRNLGYEIFFTTIVTTLILQIQYMRREQSRIADRMKILLSTADFGLWDWNSNQNKIFITEAWANKFGYRFSENRTVRIEQLLSIIHDADRTKVRNEIDKLLNQEIQFLKTECRVRNSSKKYRWVFVTGKVMERDHLNRPLHILGTLVDIQTLKETKAKNKDLEAQLIQSQKMESIGTLAGGIAHDFNNLLTVINGHTEIANMYLNDPHKLKDHLDEILSAGKRATRLTRQLLAFSRKQIYKPQPLDINGIIKDLGTFLQRLIGEDINIKMILSQNMPTIMADPSQLEQILMNLVVNARDAINEKTTVAAEKKITIETQNIIIKDTYIQQHPFSSKGNFILLSVSDNGKGMNSHIKEKIFEPFFTTKPQGKGTGLGMATVYGIVKQNNGHVIVYSEEGEGTTIKIYWPVGENASHPFQNNNKEPKNINGNEHILLVEDDQGVRKFAINILRKYGYQVKEAKNGIEAQSILKEEIEWPQLLITDLIMPQMNGRELAETFSQLAPNCKILFTSGYTDNHIVHNGALESHVHFIQKPYSVLELLQKVRFVLDETI